MEFANKFLAIMLCVVSVSCSKDDAPNAQLALNNTVVLKVLAADGTSNYLNGIDTEQISLYYEDNDQLHQIITGGDYPKGYMIFSEFDDKFIKIFSYTDGTNTYEKTLIDWGEGELDTLAYKVIRFPRGRIEIDSLTFNGDPITNLNEYGIYYVTKE